MSTDRERDEEMGGGDLLDALAQAERASMKPPAGSKGETWKRVVGTVAVNAPPIVEPTSIAGPSAAAPWLKIILGVVVGGVVAIGGYQLASEPEPEPAPPAPTVAAAPRAPAPAPAPSPSVAPAPIAPPPAPVAVVADPDPPPDPPPPKKAKPAPEVPDDEPPASDLAEETRLLARARAHLRAESPKKALAPITEHARRFPKGQLEEDRMVLHAQALCASGDLDAGIKAEAALRKSFPKSPHLARVRRACS